MCKYGYHAAVVPNCLKYQAHKYKSSISSLYSGCSLHYSTTTQLLCQGRHHVCSHPLRQVFLLRWYEFAGLRCTTKSSAQMCPWKSEDGDLHLCWLLSTNSFSMSAASIPYESLTYAQSALRGMWVPQFRLSGLLSTWMPVTCAILEAALL